MVTLQELHEAQYRHARHYLEQLRMANEVYRSGGERVWQTLEQFLRDWDQIERGQSWAAHQQDAHARAADLCNEFPLAGAGVLLLHHTVRDRIAWREAALTAAIELDLRRPQCMHLIALGRAYWEAGETEQAHGILHRALAFAEDSDDLVNQAEAHAQLGAITQQEADLATASHHAQTALDMFNELDDQRGRAHALWIIAGIRGYEANFAEAERYGQSSLELFRAIDDQRGIAQALTRLGSLAGIQSNNALAEQYYHESYDIYRRLGDSSGQGLTLKLLGGCAHARGDFAEARQWFEQCLVQHQRQGNQQGIASAYENLGEQARVSGDYEQALEYGQLALAIFRTVQASDDVARVLIDISGTVEHIGQVEQAIEYALEARDIYRELNNHRWLAYTLGKLGMYTSERHEFPQAEAYLTEGLTAAEASGDPWMMVVVKLNWSKFECLRGVLDKARQHWCQALEYALQVRSTPLFVESISYLVDILVAAEELELAYELAYFVAEHPSALETVKTDVINHMNQIQTQLPDKTRQAAIERAQARDLVTYCELLLAQCALWCE